MKKLSIDIETYSSVDLIKCGVYRYCDSDDFEILLFAYSFDDEEIQVIDLAQGEDIPIEVIEAIRDPKVIKTAYNANFERTCLSKHLNQSMPANQWKCSSVHALTLGLPGYLDGVAKCLRLPEQKMKEGKALIRFFSIPCKATKANGGRTRNLPEHDMERWESFKAYCKQDVEVERQIRKKLEAFPIPKEEQILWELDQRINDDGIKIDSELVANAIECDEDYQKKRLEEAADLTGLENPNSPQQLKDWLGQRDIEVDSLSKDKVVELLEETSNPEITRVLELRQDMSKTSVKKYQAMERAVCRDEMIKGLLQFYGAATGRWAGRIINPQNLPRNDMKDLDLARRLLKSKNYEALELLFDSVPDLLSQLIRTAFIPSHHSRFIVSDFSAIEARIIAWIAGETWVVETFKGHGKIYEMTASKMFGVPLEKIVKGNPEYEYRTKGKLAVLACGYQGSVGALISMGALDMGLAEEELKPLVNTWRKSNPNIVKLWWNVEAAAIKAVKEKVDVKMQYGLEFSYRSGILFIKLPSGRSLAYVRPRVELDDRFNKDKLTFEGVVPGTRKWGRVDTYGGKLVENIIQAIARDCLAVSMLRLDKVGYKIVTHVHDEVVLDVQMDKGSLEEVESIMGESISWAPGLPLNAEGFETEYYKKD